MVFEAIVAEVLNKFLGEYIANLDGSQLKIGIWGGDVVLKDLELKPTALDELDLPFKTTYGRLGKLVLKIPWTNLYNAPVVATVERLFILAVPHTDIKYDAEKEEKYLQDAKQSELQRVEAAKKLEREKDKPKGPDTFAEKLVTQIIKNVQLAVSDIHIRYEDNYSHPERPFSFGVTLHNIRVHSTDENWKECIVQDTVSAMIYKVLKLESLAVYWNCLVPFFPRDDPTEIQHKLSETICSKHHIPPEFKYILGPINLEAQLQINPKPENDGSDFAIPKLLLGVTLEKLSLALSKDQYQALIMFIESLDGMSRSSAFRKFHPDVPVKGNCKIWWQYAYNCVVYSEVRRRQLNWDWNHMREHREMCRNYAEAYRTKLVSKKLPLGVASVLQNCEKELDVFNIVIIRQKIEVEVERESLKPQEKKGWFSGWFSSSAPKDDDVMTAAAIVKKFENAMTAEEKQKLYKAIDYQEHSVPTQYPKTFVELAFNFELRGLAVEVRDDSYDDPRVVCAELKNVVLHVEQRPSAEALKLVAAVDSFSVYGMSQGDIVPQMVSFKPLMPGIKLLDILFETNPLDGDCDQRVQLTSRPLEIIYDAETINKLVDVFQTPSSLAISQLQAAAESKLSDMKEMSAVGLQYAIEKHSILDINIDISASYCILPFGGLYRGNQDLLIVNLGHLNMVTVNQDRSAMTSVKEMYDQGCTEEEILETMSAQSYDKFMLRLTDVQVLLALEGEDWEATLQGHERCAMHVLEPTSIEVLLLQCLIADDPRLPKFKVEGLLPSLLVNLEDERVLHLVALGTSIPLPSDTVAELPETKHGSMSHVLSMTSGLSRMIGDSSRDIRIKNHCTVCGRCECKLHTLQDLKSDDLAQIINVKLNFVLRDLQVSVFKKASNEQDESERLLDFKIVRLVFQMVQRTFDMTVDVRLGSVDLIFTDLKQQIGMLSTPMTEGEDKYMFLFKFVKVSKTSPEFHSRHGSVVQLATAQVVGLTVLLHQEALLALWEFGAVLQVQLEGLLAGATSGGGGDAPSASLAPQQTLSGPRPHLPTIMEEEEDASIRFRRGRRVARAITEAIDMKVVCKIFSFRVELLNRRHSLASFSLEGGSFDVIVKKSYTEIIIKLKDVAVYDPNPVTKHHQIMSVMGEEALSVQVILFNVDEMDINPETVDMTIITKTSAIRFVFVNSFLTTVLNFIHSFKTMQEILEEMARDAAEAALQNVQDAYVKATRVALSIHLQAPIVIIPASSMSLSSLEFDLGILNITNRFEMLSITNERGQKAIIDEITVELQDMKLSRVRLDIEGKVTSGHELLKPISCTLLLKRNISCSWYTNVPYVDCSGRLQTIVVNISDEDFAMIKRIANENFAEGELIPEEIQVKPSLEFHNQWQSTVQSKRPKTLDVKKSGITAPSYKELTPTTGAVSTMVKFTFTMDSLIIDLFTTSYGPESESIHKGLARFSFNILSLKGHMYSDGTLSTSVLLVDCLLDDTRGREEAKITRLMQRKTDLSEDDVDTDDKVNDEPFRSMLDVTFQKKGQDMFVDVRVFGFDLVLSTEYLMKIADFFVGWSCAPEVETSEDQEEAAAALKSVSSTSTTKQSSKFTQPTEEVPEGMMTINLRVEKPDIIMVETMDDFDTRSLVLNMELTLKLRLSKEHQVICGSIKDLQFYSCIYNIKRREDTTHQILRPCCISIAGSTPGGEGMHLDVCLTPLRLSVSPATFELLYNVQKGLVIPETKKEFSVVEEINYSDLWQPKPFREDEHWFFRTELAEEATAEIPEAVVPPFHEEMCIISAPSVVVTMEAGVGQQTLPMILADLSLHSAISNWSSQMVMDSCMSLEVKYYNSALALWEPIVEPVEVEKDGTRTHVPWELRLEVQVNPVEEAVQSPTSVPEDMEEVPVQSPAMAVSITSNENLEITLTKTCLDVLVNLTKSFETALTGLSTRAETVAPFTVKNDTGLAVAVMLQDSRFHVFTTSEDIHNYREVMLESGAKVELLYIDPDGEDLLDQAPTSDEDLLKIKVIERNCVLELPVKRADKRYFSLKHRGDGNDPWGLISDVQVKDGGTLITLRSVIQVSNHFNVPVNVYYMTKRGNEVECVGTVEQDKHLNLPLYSVYTPTNELFFSVEGYTVSVVPFIWKDLQNMLTVTQMLQCDPKNGNNEEPFFMKIIGVMEQVFFESSARHTMLSTCYNIHLRPAVVIKNHLPVDVVVFLADTAIQVDLASGCSAQLPNAEPGMCSLVIRIPEYLEKEWSCRHELEQLPNIFTVWTFHSYDSIQKVSLDLGMRTSQRHGSMVMTLYCPYWMLNKTGLMLTYRQSDETANVLYHPEEFKEPILFSFKAKSFFGKKKACVKVEDSEWSDKFPLDVAGSSGVVTCKHADMVYKLGVYIQLTYSTLTKQVTFTPYYVLLNNAAFPVEVQEAERPADPWIQVEPNDCMALWPHCHDTKHLRARIAGTEEITAPFAYDNVYTTLLRLDNKYGGLNVDIQVAEGSVYISFMSYEPGLAPALILNHLDVPVTFHEEDDKSARCLDPMESIMFTWLNPLGARRLVWTNHKRKEISDELKKDGIEQFSPVPNKTAYWVSFLDGMQRVLLFTYDMNVARDAQSAGEMEHIDQEITIAIHGVGFSLVNNISGTETIYCGLASSGVIWETSKMNNKRFKPLNMKDTKLLEDAYTQHNQAQVLGEVLGPRWLPENKYEVDFEVGEILKPQRRKLRRTYNTGLWFQMKTSKHQMQLHAKLNRLQVDNQMQDCLFPVILAPVPLPRSIAANSALKPFFELSIVRRLMEHSPVVQYKYFKVLVQEFHVKLDIGFINALLQFFEAEEISDEDEQNRFMEDRKLVSEPLMSHALLQSTAEQKNFYDLLHFSPLKIHLSFSLSTSGQSGLATQEMPAYITVLMQSLGVTLTDVQDVIFKLAYFERQYTFLTQRQLMSEAKTHYIGQALKQLYVLVLGLDVLGNPYGLVLGVARGVEDLFYEPFQGAIQGPGEFAEGLVLGVRSLFGHTVGGAAGAVSRITGAMGKGVAALTFDKDYQRKRREAMQRRPNNIHTGLAQSGKGLVMGVVDGVSGVFTKPIAGAREEGVEGFFKGVGKGVVGLVTRPTAGIIDFASGTLEQVKRAADQSEEVTRLRPPRFMHPDGHVRPYDRYAAEGYKLLMELEKGRYNSTDIYSFHVNIVAGGKDVLLMTDKRVMYVVHNEVFGGWQADWEYTWESLSAPPVAVEKGVFLTTGEPRRKVLGLFGTADKGGKIILVKDQTQRDWLVKKMNEIMKN